MRASYKNLVNDLQKAESNAKGAEEIIAYDQETIAKARLLLQDNKHILEQENRRIEELDRGKIAHKKCMF